MSDAAIVTFLFTDLVSSSDLYARLGDDAAEQVRRSHFRALRDAVTASGGREVKSMGDGLMVVFGSAVDAVNCAIAIQQAVDRENRRTELEPLGVRVGLHIGEPIRDEDDYFGQAVVIARRLCDSADGGQIIVSDFVRTLVASRGAFGFTDLGPLELKGVPGPTLAAEVVWERTGAEQIPLPAPLEPTLATPFVARTDERERLGVAWKAAQTGDLRLALVAGEPGIGKTRLTSEFVRSAYGDGATVLFGRCDEDVLVPYQPFVEALRHYIVSVPSETLRSQLGGFGADLARIVPELSQRVTGLAQPEQGEPETERYRLFEAVTSLLREIAGHEPTVLVVDDLHWADKPTLLLLRHIVRSPETARLLIIATYRETELGRKHPLDELIDDFRRESRVERISLDGLDVQEIADLLARSAQHDVGRRGQRLAEALHDATEGNPFFVLQVMGHLIETGRIYQQDGVWTFDVRIEEMGLPEGVKQVIGRRLSRLSDACNAVLTPASVLGREFEFATLRHMTDGDDDGLIGTLDEALGSGLVVEVRGVAVPTYAFSHALVRQTLYDEIHLARKQRLHLRAAEAIEKSHSRDLDRFLSILADHYRLAGAAAPADKALDYSLRAAQAASAVFAWEEVATHLEGALELMEDNGAPADERARLLLRLGDLMYSVGLDLHQGIRYLERALALYEEIGDVERAAQTHSRLGRSLSTDTRVMDVPRAIGHYERASTVLSAGEERPAVGYLQIGLSTGYMYAARLPEALAAAERGLEIADRLGNEQMWANAAILCGQHLITAGRFGEAFALLDEAWQKADALDQVFLSSLCATTYANWMSQFDPNLAIAIAERELVTPRIARAGRQRENLTGTLAWVYLSVGDRDHFDELVQVLDPEHDDRALALVANYEGDWATGLRINGESLAIARASGNEYTVGPNAWRMGLAEFHRGNFEAAESHFRDALIVADRPGSVAGYLFVDADLALMYAWSGRVDDMRPHVDRLEEIFARGQDWKGWTGIFLTPQAALAFLDGDTDRATTLFTEAIDASRRFQLAWDEATTSHTWGRLLVQAGDPSGHEKLDDAIAIYQRIRAGQPWIDRVEESRALG